MLRAVVFVALFAVPTAALADRADADACAKGLKGQSKVAYRSVVGHVQRGSTLEDAVRRALQPKVDSGRMSENEARSVGRQAADCARLVHRGA